MGAIVVPSWAVMKDCNQKTLILSLNLRSVGSRLVPKTHECYLENPVTVSGTSGYVPTILPQLLSTRSSISTGLYIFHTREQAFANTIISFVCTHFFFFCKNFLYTGTCSQLDKQIPGTYVRYYHKAFALPEML